jgi:hypothetical protein
MSSGIALFIFIFSIYGLANAVAVLKLGQFFFGRSHCTTEGCTAPGHPRETRRGLGRIPYLGDLFYCPPCLAFWFGIGLSRLGLSPSALSLDAWWKAALVDGLLASGVVWLLHVTAERLGDGLDL